MKTLFSALLLSCIIFANAQTTTSSNELVSKKQSKHAKQKAIAQELNLTTAQKEKMAAYNKEFATKHKAIHTNAALTENDKKAQQTALRKEKKEKMDEVLTPEQKEKVKSLRKKAKQAKDATALMNKKSDNYSFINVSKTESINADIKSLQAISNAKYSTLNEQLGAINTVLDDYIAAIGITLSTEELEELYGSGN
jgi:Spy/CpxP family protein refolding chaperone